MYCSVTRKVAYDSEVLAEEALVSHHIRQFHRQHSGPTNIYQCDHCGSWHFTSKGERHPALDSQEERQEMDRLREALHWERKLRR